MSFDISPHFSDPDGDDLDYFIRPWSDPLPAGLSLDSETGLITGTFEGLGNEIARLTFFYAEDPSGAQSGTRGFVIWVPVSYGPVADLFVRTCDPDLYDCIPGYNIRGQSALGLFEFNEEGTSASLLYAVPPTQEETRMSASVGYESGEPVSTGYLRPTLSTANTSCRIALAVSWTATNRLLP